MEFLHRKQTESDRLLGISSEAAVAAVGNRYDLVLIASRRARELRRGDAAHIVSRRDGLVTALNEIEQGYVGREYLSKSQTIDQNRHRKFK